MNASRIPSSVLRSAVVASFFLSGCAALPVEGTPQAFDVDVPSPSTVDFVAGAPTRGMTPEALVEGFLRACSAGTSDEFDTARLFLTKTSAHDWQPEAMINVYATDATPQTSTEKLSVEQVAAEHPKASKNTEAYDVFVSAPAVAQVDQRGNLTEVSAGTVASMRFRVVKEEGEWRIHNPEPGIVISAASFNASYQLSQIFFPLKSGQALTAEGRWFPRKGLARYLMNALIEGPSAVMQPAVENAIPADATLGENGVEITQGSARISLNATMPPTEHEKLLAAWQIAQTLRQSAQVSDVNVSIAGVSLPMDRLPVEAKFRLDDAIANTSDGVGHIHSGELIPLSALLPTPVGEAQRTPVLAEVTRETWDGMPRPAANSRLTQSPLNPAIVAWVGDGQMVVVDRSTKQSAQVGAINASWPSVDRFGWAWTVGHGGNLMLAHPSGAVSPLSSQVPLSGGINVRVSPDGSRAVFLRRNASHVSVWVGTIERDKNGVPLGIAYPRALAKLSDSVRDISWASANMLIALQGEAGAQTMVVTVPMGGFTQSFPAPEGAIFLTAGESAQSLYVTDVNGAVWSRSNSMWQPIEAEVLSLRFPG